MLYDNLFDDMWLLLFILLGFGREMEITFHNCEKSKEATAWLGNITIDIEQFSTFESEEIKSLQNIMNM